MQLFGIITSIIAASASVSALPKPNVAKREAGGVLLCQGANATGKCHYETFALDECHDMPEAFYRNTKTFAPDGEDFYCWPRVSKCSDICKSPTGCTFGGTFYFNHPHKYDISKISWDKSISSFDCHKNSTTNSY
ncbi:hypothetical protein GGS20DRAFT_556779 [Poronia punctata]|nr:hypothetical protein GGS20DRAFT_556779 [Poronia punctata]